MSSVNTDLWDKYNGKGFAAEYSKYSVRASKDENGNNIMSTYATKEAVDGKANKLVPASANNLAALDTNGAARRGCSYRSQ